MKPEHIELTDLQQIYRVVWQDEHDQASSEDEFSAARGLFNGFLISLAIWALIWAVWRWL